MPLAPVQAVVVPVSDRHVPYARELEAKLSAADIRAVTDGLRVEVDDSSERMQKKIRNAQLRKVPYQFIVGDREMNEKMAGKPWRNKAQHR